MPRASAAQATQTARDILEAATRLFAQVGFAAASVDDVARTTGVTKGAVYHHYGSKRGLLDAVTATLQAKVAQTVVDHAERAGVEPHDQLRAGSHAFIDAATSGPTARILLVEAPAVLGWKRWRVLDAENSMLHLHEALSSAGAPIGEIDALTVLLSGAMNEAALWVTRHPDPAAARAQAHTALDRLLTACLVPPPD